MGTIRIRPQRNRVSISFLVDDVLPDLDYRQIKKTGEYMREFIINRAIDLSIIGVNELAWNYSDSLEILDNLLEQNIIIYGGDVLKIDGDRIAYTYDNWYYEGDNYIKSYDKAKDYIINYCIDNGYNHYFVIVVENNLKYWESLKKLY